MGKRGRPPTHLDEAEVNMILKVMAIVKKFVKKKWKASKTPVPFADQMPCPMCEMKGRRTVKEGRGVLHFRVAINGHCAAKCTVPKCVSIVE